MPQSLRQALNRHDRWNSIFKIGSGGTGPPCRGSFTATSRPYPALEVGSNKTMGPDNPTREQFSKDEDCKNNSNCCTIENDGKETRTGEQEIQDIAGTWL